MSGSGVPRLFGAYELIGFLWSEGGLRWRWIWRGPDFRCGGLTEIVLNLRNNQKRGKRWSRGWSATPTLKSELGYLRLESLQALGNGGFEVKETLVFGGVCVLTYLIKIKLEHLYGVPRSLCYLALF